MAVKGKDSCYQKAAADEELFTLRAQDYTSPKAVVLWIAENINSLKTSDEKLRDAFECALRMRKHPNRKSPD